MTWVNPLLTELLWFWVFCRISPQHHRSCCRAPGVVWLVPLHYMSVTVSRSSTGAWRKVCWELLNVLLPFLLSLKKDHNLTFFWLYLFYIWLFILIQILLSYIVKISLYFKKSLLIYKSVKHFFKEWHPRVCACKYHCMKWVFKAKPFCFREKKNTLNLNNVSKRQPNCHPNVAALPFLASCYIKDNWGML